MKDNKIDMPFLIFKIILTSVMMFVISLIEPVFGYIWIAAVIIAVPIVLTFAFIGRRREKGMSRYINADALIAEMERCSYETWSKRVNPTWWAQAVKVKDNIKECIERQPTADVVEVVRCKDCEYSTEDHEDGYACDIGIILGYQHGNDYCSYGKRRTDDEG